jgi:hypothetical protein
LRGAIEQHFPKTLAREPGRDFRLPSATEEELTERFQLSLGRQNELELTRVRLRDPGAENGRLLFLDDTNGRCNVCHHNAGANFKDSGANRNFNTGTLGGTSPLNRPNLDESSVLLDAGFGGRDLPSSDFPMGDGQFNGFGNGSFNPPPLIEAADTAPFFHNNLKQISSGPENINDAVLFYSVLGSFLGSPAAEELNETLGPLDLDGSEAADIARFLRVLNAALNADIARQRLDAVATLIDAFGDERVDVQRKLLSLARAEVEDALQVLIDGNPEAAPNPVAIEHLGVARDEIDRAIAASRDERELRTVTAIDEVGAARAELGDGIEIELGEGNLMY